MEIVGVAVVGTHRRPPLVLIRHQREVHSRIRSQQVPELKVRLDLQDLELPRANVELVVDLDDTPHPDAREIVDASLDQLGIMDCP